MLSVSSKLLYASIFRLTQKGGYIRYYQGAVYSLSSCLADDAQYRKKKKYRLPRTYLHVEIAQSLMRSLRMQSYCLYIAVYGLYMATFCVADRLRFSGRLVILRACCRPTCACLAGTLSEDRKMLKLKRL